MYSEENKKLKIALSEKIYKIGVCSFLDIQQVKYFISFYFNIEIYSFSTKKKSQAFLLQGCLKKILFLTFQNINGIQNYFILIKKKTNMAKHSYYILINIFLVVVKNLLKR